MSFRFPLPQILLCPLVLLSISAAGEAARWQPVKDEVFLQESGYQIKTGQPILSVGILGEEVYAGFQDGLQIVRKKHALPPGQDLTGTQPYFLEPVADAPAGPIHRLLSLKQRLLAFTPEGLFTKTDSGWAKLSEGAYTDACVYREEIIVSGGNALYRLEGNALAPLPHADAAPGPITALAAYAESLYCIAGGAMTLFDGTHFRTEKAVEFGKFPSKELRDLLADGSRLLVATPEGLGVLRGTAATAIRGLEGLPYEAITALSDGFAKDVWAATPAGAIRAVNGEYHWFSGPRWLPDNQVNAIACGGSTAYLATNAGLGIIDYEPYTLLKKAAYYERHLEEWGQKRMAFVHKLEWNQDKGGWVREVSDNDVGWSTHYWASQAFKYAATQDKLARQNAVDGFNCLKWSEEITSIDGFPARSIWAVGETGNRATGGSGGYPAEWNPTPDGLWAWKGDTSSDETDAHYYFASIFYELAANNAEKEQVREHLDRVSTHIIEHGWTLCDLDGKPTVWARWDPEYFAGKGRYARGLNGLEVLNYMRTTEAITGNPKYGAALQQLLDMDYTSEVIYQKLVFPPDAIFHSDDRLAFYNYYTILQYESDPHLRSIYAQSLERSYEIERIEHIPWFNFIYGARTGNDCETQEAARHLREWPLDMVQYPFDFTNRADNHTPPGYVPYAGLTRAYSPRERGPARWTNNMGDEKGGGGHEVEDPSGWLDAYWMGRYYGFILAPETTDPALTTVPKRDLHLGAVPYDGPPMPDVLKD